MDFVDAIVAFVLKKPFVLFLVIWILFVRFDATLGLKTKFSAKMRKICKKKSFINVNLKSKRYSRC